MPNGMQWRVITPTLLDELPELPGMFEVGSLVRNVLFIGSAPGGIAAALREALMTPRLLSRAHCVRFEVTEAGDELARSRLAEYRREHNGAVPFAHRQDALAKLLDGRRPPSRALPLSRSGRRSGPGSLHRNSHGA